ncbi:S-adenosyl-L-methionine-dependent methyltransferase [Aspergillus ambiguus]|uniref:DNA cytosine methyltransferase n=1 Tax=Aspergillus ambiguus TaxID=176160 RepID=UPI003CCD23F3
MDLSHSSHPGGDDGSDTSSFTIENSPRNSPRHSYIAIDDPDMVENDPDEVYSIRDVSPNTQELVDLTDLPRTFQEGDYLTDEDLHMLLDNWSSPDNTQPTFPDSNASTEKLHVDEICVDGIVYQVGQSLELHDKTYLRITSILLTDAAGSVEFFGRRLGRARNHVHTYIPRWDNELIWAVNETETVSFSAVKQFVRINFTNFCHVEQDQLKAAKPRELFCRLKKVMVETKDIKYNIFSRAETSVEYLACEEADNGFKFQPSILRHAWRGPTQPFGEREKGDEVKIIPVIMLEDSASIIDLTEDTNGLQHARQYTLGDAFCGAGGVSCGARRAGLHNEWAVDFSQYALETYRLNFPDTDCWQADITSFLSIDHDNLRVDVAHGSPPCQTFSPAHTREGRYDDANSACIFVGSNMIRKLRPRIYTMEETSGLLQQRQHTDTFYRVVQDFLEIGYSVRWSVVNCMDYGVPQRRKRLLVIASGPGERLPPFPRPTHGIGAGLKPYTTINQMISGIPPGAPDHDVEGALSRGIQRTPFDSRQQARCITTGGGDGNYHPSGERGFTNREFACLQTFPMGYRFGSREVRKQIGNAVPPALAEVLYREIIQSLQETDKAEMIN